MSVKRLNRGIAVVAIAATTGLSGAILAAPAYAADGNANANGNTDVVCENNVNGWGAKVDTTGDPYTVSVSAPAGYEIAAYCIKGGNDPGKVTTYLTTPQKTLVLSGDELGGHAISHYVLKLTPVTVTETEPEPETQPEPETEPEEQGETEEEVETEPETEPEEPGETEEEEEETGGEVIVVPPHHGGHPETKPVDNETPKPVETVATESGLPQTGVPALGLVALGLTGVAAGGALYARGRRNA